MSNAKIAKEVGDLAPPPAPHAEPLEEIKISKLSQATQSPTLLPNDTNLKTLQMDEESIVSYKRQNLSKYDIVEDEISDRNSVSSEEYKILNKRISKGGRPSKRGKGKGNTKQAETGGVEVEPVGRHPYCLLEDYAIVELVLSY